MHSRHVLAVLLLLPQCGLTKRTDADPVPAVDKPPSPPPATRPSVAPAARPAVALPPSPSANDDPRPAPSAKSSPAPAGSVLVTTKAGEVPRCPTGQRPITRDPAYKVPRRWKCHVPCTQDKCPPGLVVDENSLGADDEVACACVPPGSN